jgi:hypothetical protein
VAAAALLAAAAGGWIVLNDNGVSLRDHDDATAAHERAAGDRRVPSGRRATTPPRRALRLLRGLPAADTTAAVAYDRDSYGEAWADTDGNGCNQRDDVLLRDAVAGTVTIATQGSCDHDVLAGSWRDPYTRQLQRLDDIKDPVQAQAITIDHIVPQAEAHRAGADQWEPAHRESFANDLDNLVAVDGEQNSAKADRDPAHWLPPAAAVRCAYAIRWVRIKHDWQLGVDTAERAALRHIRASRYRMRNSRGDEPSERGLSGPR